MFSVEQLRAVLDLLLEEQFQMEKWSQGENSCGFLNVFVCVFPFFFFLQQNSSPIPSQGAVS